MLAPAAESGGMPAWLQGLLLLTLISGVGVAGWLLWSRADSVESHPVGVARDPDGQLGKGPITGTVNGLGADDGEANEEAAAEMAANEPEAVEAADEPSEAVEAPVADKPKEAEPEVEPVAERKLDTKTPEPKKPASLAIPTQNLPRDPAKASDVLVHRALPLIRNGELARAEATLDRAWELDPRNPQAMAGYARLYIAMEDGQQAVKWAKKAAKKRSKRASYHVLYGDALNLQGETAAARKAWRKALSIDPGNRDAKRRLAKTAARAAN